jgi:hypothetical protein
MTEIPCGRSIGDKDEKTSVFFKKIESRCFFVEKIWDD